MARRTTRHAIEAEIPALRRFAYALTRDRDAADDLVQEALTRALGRWHLLRSEAGLHTWLFRILHNLHRDGGRRASRQGQPVPLESVPLAGSAPGPEAALFLGDVLAALARLPVDQQEVLLLVGVEDFSYDATARILGIPKGTVMSRLARGRAALRQMTGHEAPPRPGPNLRRLK